MKILHLLPSCIANEMSTNFGCSSGVLVKLHFGREMASVAANYNTDKETDSDFLWAFLIKPSSLFTQFCCSLGLIAESQIQSLGGATDGKRSCVFTKFITFH